MNEEISENVACVKVIEIMKTLVLLVICLCGLCGLVEGHGFAKIVIGKDTLNMYPCPIEQDCVLEEAFMLARKSRPKADYGRVCISKRYYGESNTMNSWCVR